MEACVDYKERLSLSTLEENWRREGFFIKNLYSLTFTFEPRGRGGVFGVAGNRHTFFLQGTVNSSIHMKSVLLQTYEDLDFAAIRPVII